MQKCLTYNFFRRTFLAIFSTDSKSASNSAFFDTHIEWMWKKNILGHISTFCKLWSPTRTKRLKKTKNVFYKCFLEFNFASISGSGFFIFSKKVKIVVPKSTVECTVVTKIRTYSVKRSKSLYPIVPVSPSPSTLPAGGGWGVTGGWGREGRGQCTGPTHCKVHSLVQFGSLLPNALVKLVPNALKKTVHLNGTERISIT